MIKKQIILVVVISILLILAGVFTWFKLTEDSRLKLNINHFESDLPSNMFKGFNNKDVSGVEVLETLRRLNKIDLTIIVDNKLDSEEYFNYGRLLEGTSTKNKIVLDVADKDEILIEQKDAFNLDMSKLEEKGGDEFINVTSKYRAKFIRNEAGDFEGLCFTIVKAK